jgi:hypothetical protein
MAAQEPGAMRAQTGIDLQLMAYACSAIKLIED